MWNFVWDGALLGQPKDLPALLDDIESVASGGDLKASGLLVFLAAG